MATAIKQIFSVDYINSEGTPSLFFVDFIILFKNSVLGLFDTKTIGSDQEMVAKHNALIDYIENLKNKNIIAVGGIIVPKDGSWKYPSSKINNNFNDDNWQIFDPVNIARG